ncbi:uncharacterized protein LOC116118770 [Pistacia vera]|uniref:uncharacterized protein LOC116118770 n=1 Tax=Pistacia vera TaxID=55513 RepID=UPI0012638540|nr:uncharacterized protein LOC116118770 [Pistacia vera]
MAVPNVQRELTSVCAYLMTKKIIAEIVRDKQPCSLLVDESHDVAVKEQMAIIFRYVDKIGSVIERFIGVVHVKKTSAKSLKIAIDFFFVKHGLSLTSLWGQGYDGASNMRAASCKHRDFLRDKQYENVISLISNGDLHMGRGLNQKCTIKRPGDTRWGSHIGTIHSVINLFSSVVDVHMQLDLPVATATVERVFSTMNLVKNSFRNRIGDDWMNNCLVVYIEKEFFATIENEDIIEHLQNISKRKIVLN